MQHQRLPLQSTNVSFSLSSSQPTVRAQQPVINIAPVLAQEVAREHLITCVSQPQVTLVTPRAAELTQDDFLEDYQDAEQIDLVPETSRPLVVRKHSTQTAVAGNQRVPAAPPANPQTVADIAACNMPAMSAARLVASRRSSISAGRRPLSFEELSEPQNELAVLAARERKKKVQEDLAQQKRQKQERQRRAREKQAKEEEAHRLQRTMEAQKEDAMRRAANKRAVEEKALAKKARRQAEEDAAGRAAIEAKHLADIEAKVEQQQAGIEAARMQAQACARAKLTKATAAVTQRPTAFRAAKKLKRKGSISKCNAPAPAGCPENDCLPLKKRRRLRKMNGGENDEEDALDEHEEFSQTHHMETNDAPFSFSPPQPVILQRPMGSHVPEGLNQSHSKMKSQSVTKMHAKLNSSQSEAHVNGSFEEVDVKTLFDRPSRPKPHALVGVDEEAEAEEEVRSQSTVFVDWLPGGLPERFPSTRPAKKAGELRKLPQKNKKTNASGQPVAVHLKKPKDKKERSPRISAPLRASSVHAAVTAARRKRLGRIFSRMPAHEPYSPEEKDEDMVEELASQSALPKEHREASHLRRPVDLVKHNQWLPPAEYVAPVAQRRKLNHIDDLVDHGVTDFTENERKDSDIPQMTKNGYVRLARGTLSEETVHFIQSCTSEAAPGLSWTVEDARAITAAPEPTKEDRSRQPLLGIIDCGSSVFGVQEFRFIAQRAIKCGQLIGFHGGQLMEDAEHKQHPSSNMCLHIPREELAICEYEGPSLTLCCENHQNFGALIRPPEDACTEITRDDTKVARQLFGGDLGPVQGNHLVNVKLNFFIDKASGVVFALLVAARRIPAGHELLLVRTLGSFISDQHFQLMMGGRQCHHIHARLRQLERALVMHRIKEEGGDGPEDIDQLTLKQQAELIENIVPEYTPCTSPKEKKSGRSAPVNSVAPLKSAHIFDIPFKMVHAPKTKPCELPDVFDHTQVVHTRRAFLATAAQAEDPQLVKLLARQPENLPDYLYSFNGRQKFIVDKDQLKFVLEHGFDYRLLYVAEDISLHSAVRLFSIPPQPSFGVYAKQHIPGGTFLYAYVGQMRKEGLQDKTSDYIYGVPADVVREVLPEWDLPEMTIDAKRFGSVGRLVNDNRYRSMKAYSNDEASINVESRWAFWHGMIHFAFYAAKPIRKDQELVTVSPCGMKICACASSWVVLALKCSVLTLK